MKHKKAVEQFRQIRRNVDWAAFFFDQGDYKKAGTFMFSVAAQAKDLAAVLRQEEEK